MSYEALLFLHLVGAFLWVGGGLLAALLRVAAIRAATPHDAATLLRAVRPAVPLIGIGLVVVVGFGFWLAEDGGWDLGDAWLSVTFALLLGMVVVGAVAGRQDRHTRELAERLAAEGNSRSDELARRLRDPLNLALNGSILAATVAVVALMVFKPGS